MDPPEDTPPAPEAADLEAATLNQGLGPAAPRPPAGETRRFGRRRRIASALVVATLLAIRIGSEVFATHSNEPQALPSGAIVRDDFSRSDSGWKSSSGPNASAGYEGGAYLIDLRRGAEENAWLNVNGASLSAIRVQADVRRTSGEQVVLGVDCVVREAASEALYLFLIMPTTGEYLILRGSGGHSVALADGLDQTPGVIDRGDAENTVEGDCLTTGVQTSLALTVNGSELADVQDPHPLGTFEGIGLSAGAPAGATATFDNAQMDQLSEPASNRIAAGAAPQPAPAPARGRVAIADSFTHPSTGWGIANKPNYQLGYVDGSYRIYVTRPREFRDWYHWGSRRYPDVSVEVTAKVAGLNTNGWLGVGCVVRTNPIIAYDFLVSPGSRGYKIIRISPGGTSVIAEGLSPAVNPTRANDIRGDCVGDAEGRSTLLTLYLNGEHVAYAKQASTSQFVGTGMYASSADGRIDARFGVIAMWVLR
jgi:hypothetical protein